MSFHSRQPSIASSILSNATSHPQFIGPWRLGKTLGRGATGRVLLATHKTNGQKAAVKVVSKSELDEDEMKKVNQPGGLPYGIEREIIIMKLLTHPNVLRLYDVWETSKNLYLVLEYVEGGELFDLLVERGPLQESEAIKYFRQITLGTAYCHALGICHRDLKPENLLLDSNLNVKLADFGMAALESNGKLLETSCGSPHYAAPEIVSGLKYHGFASDVWSCGVILFALLTGRLPFDDENIRDLLLKVQAGSFEMPTDISFEAQDLIGKMLTTNPDQRIKTNLILKHPLLNKYPIPNEDLISVKSLPHPQTAYKSLGSIKNIDKQILQNLSILWNDRPQQEIIDCLLINGPNPEKTFYALLLRYRHNQNDLGPNLPMRTNSVKPKRKGQISASSSRHRPMSFQYKNGVRSGRLSASSSVQNSPYKSPNRASPSRASPTRASPYRSPTRASPTRSSSNTDTTIPAIPRNIYNEIVSAQRNGNMPPPLPSKDSIDHYKRVSTINNGDLMASANFSPTKSPKKSLIRSLSKNRLSRRSIGLKRNSITVKLLSTYAKLSGDSDWEYMDKQTRRTSATFATLCDKIFNQQDYNEDEENLVDEEERQAREYERLMEVERKKHEAEMKARKELAKQRKRQKRRSILSSKKLSIFIKDDSNNSENEITVEAPENELSQKKRQSKLRSISEGAGKASNYDDLTIEDVIKLKKRSVTQPVPRARKHPVLTRRPVSRLDPLWGAYENEELNRAKDALDAELKDSRSKKKKNRESMISVDLDQRKSDYKIPDVQMERSDLSEEYLSEIRKSRLLNSQLNIHGIIKEQPLDIPKNNQQRQTLIGDVKIPKVTRKSRHFTNSNKRLSVLSMYSTKESYHDLSSIVQDENNEAKMPTMRTSFADRLNRAGLSESFEEDDEEPLDEGSIMDFDEHLANKRSSYYAGTRSNTVKRHSKVNRPVSELPNLPKKSASKSKPEKRLTKDDEDYYGGLLDRDEEEEPEEETDTKVFDNIKLPPQTKDHKHQTKTKSIQPSAESMLLPNIASIPPTNPRNSQKQTQKQPPKQPKPYTKPYSKPLDTTVANRVAKPLEDTTNKPKKSIFRKLSWGSKKALEDNSQLPSPPNSREQSFEEKEKPSFFRWFSSSSRDDTNIESEIKRFRTILPKQEMSTALFALLNSWSNFGLKDLKNDTYSYIITGSISKNNSFELKSCKFRIKINSREMNQKSEIVCARVKGSKITSTTLFKEIEKVLSKEGVMDN